MLTAAQTVVLGLTANALFGTPVEISEEVEWGLVFREAMQQTVLPLIASPAMSYLSADQGEALKKRVRYILGRNIRVDHEHVELNDMLGAEKIPYVILKGSASAHYYPNPTLRTMGDVDFLVREADFERTGRLLEKFGFQPEEDRGGIHVAYHLCHQGVVSSVWEMHRSPNGIPSGTAGERTRKYLSDMMETAIETETPEGSYRIPDPFHHGLVLLLHTVSHLTSAGVGLRHLSDWAVFAASLSDQEFVDSFERPLKEIGIWRFAQLLTLCSARYLGGPVRPWAGEADEALLNAMICDIMTGGNFGQKDADRYRQIKYISNRGENTVDHKGPFRQVIHTMNRKVRAECGFAARCPVLMPVGWIVTGGRYLGLVVSGKRRIDTGKTLNAARERKDIYREFHLFEV